MKDNLVKIYYEKIFGKYFMIVESQICKWKCERCKGNVDVYVDDANNLIHKFHHFAHLITQCPYCDYILITRAEQK